MHIASARVTGENNGALLASSAVAAWRYEVTQIIVRRSRLSMKAAISLGRWRA